MTQAKPDAAASSGAYVSRAGMTLGMRLVVPFAPGLLVFGAAFGAAAAQKNLSLLEAILSSAVVFAGAAQLVSLELWREHWEWTSILAISLLVFTVNARMILMGASLQPWIIGIRPGILWPSLFLLTDPNWLIAERYRRDGGRDYGIVIGAGIVLWLMWICSTIPGYLAGTFVDDPTRYGFDIVMPIIFCAMSVPMWKGARASLPWLAAAIMSVGTYILVPGYSFIVVGALSGALAGALLPDPDQATSNEPQNV